MKKTPRSSNEKGFVVLTLVLLPAFLVLAFGAFHLNTQIIQERELQNLCRDRLLAAQKAAVSGIEELLALNPRIRALKAQLKAAREALMAAMARGSPEAIPLRVAVEAIELQLNELWIRQQGILARGRVRLAGELRKLRAELDNRVRNRKGRTATGSFDAHFRIPTTRDWALIPHLPPYPEYRVPGDFTERQALHVDWNWRFTPTEGVERWIPWKTRKDLRCGATLIRKAGTFESRIHEVKSFSRSW